MSAKVAGMTATRLGPETVAGLPHPEKSVEVGFARAAIEQDGGGYQIGPLHLRASDLEGAVLAVRLEAAVGPETMAQARQLVADEEAQRAKEEARRLIEHDPGRTPTGVLYRLRDGLQAWGEVPTLPPTGAPDNSPETQGRDVA
ncbi:hypothetical protein [Yinghuangia sp. YIM S09857]|uniref:hypothetical protein n=1 Tax=Yinghuangia sp. YIM S09857 TaxID=3436929 RepID=UPI003F536A40